MKSSGFPFEFFNFLPSSVVWFESYQKSVSVKKTFQCKQIKHKVQNSFSAPPGTCQWPNVARGYCTGHYRYRTLPWSQKGLSQDCFRSLTLSELLYTVAPRKWGCGLRAVRDWRSTARWNILSMALGDSWLHARSSEQFESQRGQCPARRTTPLPGAD